VKQAFNILLLGASYGSLLATKLALAGHNAKLICLPDEVSLINKEGTLVRMPVKGREGLYDISSKKLSGKIEAIGPDQVKADEFDLAVLAMQEPQYRSADIKNVLKDLAAAKIPCMSIMNMPPLTYLKRIIKIEIDQNKMHNAIEETSFENLRSLEMSEGFKTNPSKNPFFRKGVVGDWREKLSKDQVEKIESAFKDEMIELGYL